MEPGTENQETAHGEANITKVNVSEDKKKDYATDSTSLKHTQDKKILNSQSKEARHLKIEE